MTKKNYSSLSNNAVVSDEEMLTLKGGFVADYGCQSNVCAIDRSGAKDLCTDAYCVSGVGPKSPNDTFKPRPGKGKCGLFL